MTDAVQLNVSLLDGSNAKPLHDSPVSVRSVVITEIVCWEGGAARLKHLRLLCCHTEDSCPGG